MVLFFKVYYQEKNAESHNNTISNNTITDNKINAFDPAKKANMNQWDDGKHGNFYSDFNLSTPGFTDNNHDGIGDIAHPIPDGAAIDRYPLSQPANK